MTELKTLKEITSWTCECNCVTFDNGICRSCGDKPKYGEIDYEELKQEAIKWVKKWNVYNLEIGLNIDEEKITRMVASLVGASRAFMQFFNLTEEDLI